MGGGPRAGPVPQPVSVVSRDWVREGSPRRQGESVRRPLRGLEGADVVAGGRGADPAPGECEVVRVEKETVADSEGARRGTGPTLFPSSVLFPRVPVMTPDYRSLGLGSPRPSRRSNVRGSLGGQRRGWAFGTDREVVSVAPPHRRSARLE